MNASPRELFYSKPG